MWSLLGIAPTREVRAIKRAYAARLKLTRPEDNAQAFQQLRQAYDAALRQAAESVAAGDDDPAAVPWHRPPARDGVPAGAGASPGGVPAGVDASPGGADDAPASGGTGDTPAADQSVPPPWADEHEAAREAVQALLDINPPGDDQALAEQLQRQLAELWRQPRWLPPRAARTLEAAWLDALRRGPPGLDGGADGALAGGPLGARLSPREWLALMEAVAEHHGWLDGRSCAASAMPELLNRRLVEAGVQALFDTACREGGLAVARAQLEDRLAQPLWQGVAAHQAWQDAWAACLHRVFNSPGPAPSAAVAVLDWIVRRFDWHADALAWQSAAPVRGLLDVWTLQQDDHLLQRLANGDSTCASVPREIAQALLQPRVRREDRRAVRQASRERRDQRSWQVQVRSAIAWLDAHAPRALRAVEPRVLRWWRAEHIQANDSWNILPLPGWIIGSLGTVDAARAHWGWQGWALVLPWLVGMALGIALGFQLSALLAWLRLQWRLRPYQRWLGLDRALAGRLAARWPRPGAWLVGSDIGLTRDVLPAVAVLIWQFSGLWAHEGGSPWQAVFVAAFPTAIFMIAWSGGLRLLAKP